MSRCITFGAFYFGRLYREIATGLRPRNDGAVRGRHHRKKVITYEKPNRQYSPNLVALFIHSKTDYHWYRQNPDGSWSHKLGSDPVTNVDADDEIIWNPKDANCRYGGANYSTFLIIMQFRR